MHVPGNGGAGKRLKIWLSHIKLMDQPMALKVKILHPSMYSFIIVKKKLDDSTQALRNWPLKMWRPKDRSMTVSLTYPSDSITQVPMQIIVTEYS